MAGRWSEEIFAIIFKLPLASAPLSPSSMEHSLTTHYAVEIDGISYTIPLKVRVHAIEYSPDGDETAFYVQMGQAAFSVTAS
jgi:hypothetical protein